VVWPDTLNAANTANITANVEGLIVLLLPTGYDAAHHTKVGLMLRKAKTGVPSKEETPVLVKACYQAGAN
jgi:hypothetical protein